MMYKFKHFSIVSISKGARLPTESAKEPQLMSGNDPRLHSVVELPTDTDNNWKNATFSHWHYQ